MFKIINKQVLMEGVKRLDIYAPFVARIARPGQFVSVCVEENDERIPMSISDVHAAEGAIALIVQEAGPTSRKLGNLAINEEIFSIIGPLGVAPEISKKGTVVCVATGIGAAQILPVARAFKDAGNKVVGIIGSRTRGRLLLEPQLRLVCTNVLVATEDGSFGRRAKATDLLRQLLERESVDYVYAAGSAAMMESVCEMTRPKNIPTRVQLNPLMIDCVGMCGSCRVRVAGRSVLACMEGPSFDGHQVDFRDYYTRIRGLDICDHNQSFSPKKKESGTFMKFVSDILSD